MKKFKKSDPLEFADYDDMLFRISLPNVENRHSSDFCLQMQVN